MIIVKTKMREIPKTCRECELHTFGWGVLMCGVLKDWLDTFEYRSGKTKLENCPLEEIQK